MKLKHLFLVSIWYFLFESEAFLLMLLTVCAFLTGALVERAW